MGVNRQPSDELERKDEDHAEDLIDEQQDHSTFGIPLEPIYSPEPWNKEQLAPLLKEARIGSTRKPTSLDLKNGIDRILSPLGKEDT